MKSPFRSLTLVSATLLSLILSLTSLVTAQESYIVVERHSKRVLLAANSEQKVTIGSYSQLATAKVVLDWAKLSETPLSSMMVVPGGISTSGLKNALNLQTGDRISMRDALYSLSLIQDNSSALVLADYVGRQLLARRGKSGNPYDAFTKEMNNLASVLNMRSTRFKSPAGGLGKTKISDLAKLAAYVLKTNGYDFYMKQKSRSVTVKRVSGVSQSLRLTSTNSLLGTMSISGLMVEGPNAVISANKKNVVKKLADGRAEITPRQLVVVSFGSADRNARAKELISNGWQVYEAWRAQGFPRSEKGKEFLR
ncbi:MAG: D-alanyl-D-alanine carboxypeptidase (penicillin-binding protein 5/6) [Cryomorphaceae bacterium]|jgi:D-alanyl-D-alanine carboxypeptidase (penicillin-binding protein 5/6)